MILTISTKERVKLGEARITGKRFIATENDVSNDETIIIDISAEGIPFFFDLTSDEGDWISGGRFRNQISATSEGTEILFRRDDLHLLSRR
jgi:hypothetical protein